jgi:hypothetical protein
LGEINLIDSWVLKKVVQLCPGDNPATSAGVIFNLAGIETCFQVLRAPLGALSRLDTASGRVGCEATEGALMELGVGG